MSNIQTPDLSGQTIADTPPINAPADPVAARALANRVDGALPDQRVYSIETRLSAARRASQEVLHWMPINRHSNGEVLVLLADGEGALTAVLMPRKRSRGGVQALGAEQVARLLLHKRLSDLLAQSEMPHPSQGGAAWASVLDDLPTGLAARGIGYLPGPRDRADTVGQAMAAAVGPCPYTDSPIEQVRQVLADSGLACESIAVNGIRYDGLGSSGRDCSYQVLASEPSADGKLMYGFCVQAAYHEQEWRAWALDEFELSSLAWWERVA